MRTKLLYEGSDWAAQGVERSEYSGELPDPPSGPRHALAAGRVGEGHSCISLRKLTSMEGSRLTQHYTTFPLSLQIPWPLDAGVQRHRLLALIQDISEGPFKFQSSLWPVRINFSLCPILSHTPSFTVDKSIPQSTSCILVSISELVLQGIQAHHFLVSFFHTTIFSLSSSFPLCIGWSYIPVCWGQSYFTPANLVTHLVSTLFNSQRALI